MSGGAWSNTTIGPYRLAELVGAGGMGEVYRARHLPSGRTVAVKVLTTAAGMPEMTERFRNEARVQATMRHANIAALHELVEHHGTPCIAMEFVDGQTLDERIRRHGALPTAEALDVAGRVVDAVGYMHARGVIHRDIKPANVKSSTSGMVKLLDFGIAKGPGSPALTRTGNVIGTLQSLAPEQLEHGSADHLTDIWALGVLLHELLTGRHPFAEPGMFGIMGRIRAGQFPPPSRVNPLLPAGVDRIVARCLRVDPSQRYQSCEALLTDIRALLEPAPAGPVRAPAVAEGLLALVRSHRLAGGAAVAAGLAVALVGWAALAPSETALDPGTIPAAAPHWSAPGAVEDAPALTGGARDGRPQRAPTPVVAAIAAPPASAAPTREVTVNAFNGTADVYLGGRYVGRTPYVLRESIGTSVALVLRRAGYEDAEVSFDVTEGRRVYTITMRTRDRESSGGGRSAPPPSNSGWPGASLAAWLGRRRRRATGHPSVATTADTPRLGAGADGSPAESGLLIGIASDVGCVRDGNEDSVRVVRPAGTNAMSARGLLAVVCDGMGGHAAGETASRLAADVVAGGYAGGDSDPGVALAQAVRRANRAVFDAARGDASLAGMGTTCTAVVLRGGRAWCAHVGDSRCYLLRDGELYLMTADHSAVMELVRDRSISRDEARRHPDRNVVSRAIGSHRDVEVDVWPQPLVMRPGDRLLLSTDGLHDVIAESELCAAAIGGAPQEACRRLVALAREQGAPDNVSVIVLYLPTLRAEPAVAGATRELVAVVDADRPSPTAPGEMPP